MRNKTNAVLLGFITIQRFKAITMVCILYRLGEITVLSFDKENLLAFLTTTSSLYLEIHFKSVSLILSSRLNICNIYLPIRCSNNMLSKSKLIFLPKLFLNLSLTLNLLVTLSLTQMAKSHTGLLHLKLLVSSLLISYMYWCVCVLKKKNPCSSSHSSPVFSLLYSLLLISSSPWVYGFGYICFSYFLPSYFAYKLLISFWFSCSCCHQNFIQSFKFPFKSPQ